MRLLRTTPLGLVAFLILLSAGPVRAQSAPPSILRQPAISATLLCFSAAGDLWLAPRAGGDAHRLTASPEIESDCHFSPDGRWIAYTAARGNQSDVYIIPVTGGAPRRLTWNPAADLARGWTPRGEVLFASNRHSYAPNGGPLRLYVQGIDDVLPAPVDLPSGVDGSFSADGSRLAYMPIARANLIWKRYRGGRTTPIWIANLADAGIEQVPRDGSTDAFPMWVGDTVFFLSDRDGPTTLYAYELASHRVSRRIDNHGLDLKTASAGPGAIVYEQFGSLWSYDLHTGATTTIPVHLDGALSEAAPQWVSVSDKLQHAAISPTGVRVAFEARGEILTVPAKKGDARNVTATVDVTERLPSWSPDGQTLAYFSDAGGKGYQLILRNQNGMGAPRTLTLGGDDVYYYSPNWSPDGKRLAYTNSRGEIWLVEIATGKTTRVDTDPQGPQGDGGVLSGGMGTPSWSPDSRWLAYGRTVRNRLGAVFVYEVQSGKSTQVTDGLSDARAPAFDAGGKHLYFLCSTDAGPASDFSMMTYDHPITRGLYAIVLRRDLPSPLAPESDEEPAPKDSASKAVAAGDKPAAGKGKIGKDKAADTTAAKPAVEPVKIDFEAIDQRTIPMPTPARNYLGILPGKTGVLVLTEAPLVPVDVQADGPSEVNLYKFSLADRKLDPLIQGVNEVDLSRDGEKLLYRQKDSWAIAALAQPIKPGDGALSTGDLQVATDPRAEWKEMYAEAFRLQRAFFYDPNYHGLDLAATERYYARYLDALGCRADLDYLFAEAFGNLTVGHLFVGSPGAGSSKAPPNGVLGADYTIANGHWRFARVYAGENWNPDTRAPLTQPGVNVQAGDYLLAVNGRDLPPTESVDHALEGTAGKQVVLKVSSNPAGTGAREVTVVPLGSEVMLRHLAWIDGNRQAVDRLSGGKLAYLYVPNTANEGYTRFNRYFFAQQDRLGAVVDERFNGGGNIADYMVEYLGRRAPFNYVTARYGDDTPIPAGAIYGPKAMLINEYAGSGGDELPWLFHRFGVGPLVGKRTWGGLVGIGGYPTLMDGGFVTAPRIALWTPESEYAVENRGVAPDVEVELEPAAWRTGRDSQLEKAVAIVMEALAKQPAATPRRPAFPTWARGHTPSE